MAAAGIQKQSSHFDIFKPDKQPFISSTALGNIFESETRKTIKKSARKLLQDVPKPVKPPVDSDIILPTKRSPVFIGSRAESRTRSRLGMQSQASFFIRHNPHPFRVRHIEGLNGVPVCAVHDHDYILLPRISLPKSPYRNLRSSLQYSQPLRLQSNPLREKAVPRIGLIPMTTNWRDELQELCFKAGLNVDQESFDPKPTLPAFTNGRRSVYSRETGRLIPPPSRAMSRQSNRSASSHQHHESFTHITSNPDTETLMLEMLGQILQTDSIQAVQQWLVAASDREKALVLDMIKTAMNVEEINLMQPEGEEEEEILSPSPRPLSRMDTVRSPEYNPKHERIARQNRRSRGLVSAMSDRILASRQSQSRSLHTPNKAAKQGTFRFNKGTLTPAQHPNMPAITEEFESQNNKKHSENNNK